MDLSKLVVEGLEVKFLRARLDKLGETYSTDQKSIALLEKIVAATNPIGGPVTLEGTPHSAMHSLKGERPFRQFRGKSHRSRRHCETRDVRRTFQPRLQVDRL